MKGDVAHLTLASESPDAEAIATLEDLLARARAGTIRGIAYVTIEAQNTVGYGISGIEMKTGYLRTAGLCTWLSARALKRWEEKNEEG